MLVWAAAVEAFLSSYHSPELHGWKIGVGVVQALALFLYFGFSGRQKEVGR